MNPRPNIKSMKTASKSTLAPVASDRPISLKQQYMQSILQSTRVACHSCRRRIVSRPHTFLKGRVLCVGCLANQFIKRQEYLVIDPEAKRGPNFPLPLFDQLEILKAMERNGVQNTQFIQEQLKQKVDEAEVSKFIDLLFSKEEEKTNSSRIAVQEEKPSGSNSKSRKKHASMSPRRTAINGRWKSKGRQEISEFQEKQYEISDYLLSSLHEKSSAKEVALLSKFKIQQNNELSAIEEQIESILSRPIYSKKVGSYIKSIERELVFQDKKQKQAILDQQINETKQRQKQLLTMFEKLCSKQQKNDNKKKKSNKIGILKRLKVKKRKSKGIKNVSKNVKSGNKQRVSSVKINSQGKQQKLKSLKGPSFSGRKTKGIKKSKFSFPSKK